MDTKQIDFNNFFTATPPLRQPPARRSSANETVTNQTGQSTGQFVVIITTNNPASDFLAMCDRCKTGVAALVVYHFQNFLL
jgi:hypothetical protein